MMARGRTVPLLAVLALAACAGPDAPSSRPAGTTAAASPTAVPTTTPRSSVVALMTPAGMVLFVDPAGRTVTQVSVASPIATSAAVGQLWFVDQARHLRALGIDGRVSDLGVLRGLTAPGATAWGLAVSDDGRRWAWGELIGASTRVYVGGIDTPERVALDEATTNRAFVVLAFTARGIVVARSATGLGGCCYLPPEYGHKDALLVDPATLQVSLRWDGCATASATPLGSFACTGAALTAHPADGQTQAIAPIGPVVTAAWAHVDEAGRRLVFGVVHTRGQGDGGCPCRIDTEDAALDGGAATRLADQVLPDAVLPDGRLVVASAPAVPAQAPPSHWLLSPGGARTQLGPDGAEFLAILTTP